MVNVDVFKVFAVQVHGRRGGKGNGGAPCCRVVGIIDGHHHVAAFAFHVGGGHVFAVEFVGDLHADRQRFGAFSLIPDVLAGTIPEDVAVLILGEMFVAFDIFDIRQV